MNEKIKKKILEKIKSYGTVIISRHRRPDGDAVGSTKGLYGILKLTYPEKRIFLAQKLGLFFYKVCNAVLYIIQQRLRRARKAS